MTLTVYCPRQEETDMLSESKRRDFHANIRYSAQITGQTEAETIAALKKITLLHKNKRALDFLCEIESEILNG